MYVWIIFFPCMLVFEAESFTESGVTDVAKLASQGALGFITPHP